MPEATIICCDCSEYMRNGDFYPSRFVSQSDAVSLISNAKTQQNHENTVGLIAMHGNCKADVLVNCTQDIGRVLSSLSKMRIGDNTLIKSPSLHNENKSNEASIDSINILVALQTAQLALKHRKNKKQDQRIILFVGSPITKSQNEKLLIKAAKRLKKNNVSVDIVNFGESEENTSLLERFINAVKSNDNSHLVTVESGKLLSDVLIATPIFAQAGGGIDPYAGIGGDDDAQLNAAIAASQQAVGAGGAAAGGAGAGGGGGGGAGFAEYGGIDPSTDPELAMALRMSLEEERQRQEAEAKKAADSAANDNDNDDNDDSNKKNDDKEQPQQPSQAADNNNNDKNEAPQQPAQEAQKANDGDGDVNMADVLDIDEDDEELLKALKMSMEADDENNNNQQNEEQNFVDDLLADLPGLNQDDVDNIDELLGAVDDDEDDDLNKNDKNDKNNDDKGGDK